MNSTLLKDLNKDSFSDYLHEFIDDLKSEESAKTDKLCTTGYKSIDDLFKNDIVKEPEVCLIASRPGNGRHILAKNILLNNLKDNKKGLYISAGEDKEYFAASILSNLSNIAFSKFLCKDFEQKDFDTIIATNNKYYHILKNSFVICEPFLTIDKLGKCIDSHKINENIDFVIIDGIDSVRLNNGMIPSNEKDKLYIKDEIKSCLKTNNISAYILSDVGSEREERACKKPEYYDIKHINILESILDKVLVVYRDEYYNVNEPHYKTVDVSVYNKHSQKIGDVNLAFDGPHFKITEK